MVRRRKSTVLDDLLAIASRLPWWLSLLVALIGWIGLHWLSLIPVVAPSGPADLGRALTTQMIRTGAQLGQWIVPIIFVLGAATSAITRWRRRSLFDSVVTDNRLTDISWKQFEQWIGEAFRRQGFSITENETKGPDGGIDLVLRKDGEKHLVQCKQWRARKVGVTVIRELYGVMAAEGAAGGFVVTTGQFTEETKRFAGGRNIQLLDGTDLRRWMDTYVCVPTAASPRLDQSTGQSIPATATSVTCPLCQSSMLRRTAKRGARSGSSFWGCSRFPVCRGTRHSQ
jgi:restriction system protein